MCVCVRVQGCTAVFCKCISLNLNKKVKPQKPERPSPPKTRHTHTNKIQKSKKRSPTFHAYIYIYSPFTCPFTHTHLQRLDLVLALNTMFKHQQLSKPRERKEGEKVGEEVPDDEEVDHQQNDVENTTEWNVETVTGERSKWLSVGCTETCRYEKLH